jgi:hypothetical protein
MKLNVLSLSEATLAEATQIRKNIGTLEHRLERLLTGQVTGRVGRPPGRPVNGTNGATVATGGKRQLSEEARQRIIAAQKKRWARVHAEKRATTKAAAKAEKQRPTVKVGK